MEERDETLARLSFTTDLGEFADRDLVIEAVVENEQVKTEIFQVLDQVVTRPDAILASNTSSIPLVKLAVATSRPDQVIGIHFFNPAPVQRLVELIPALTTSDETIKRAEAVVQNVLDKHAIRAQDRSGFVVNALLIPYLLSAIRMFESGIASREDIDNGMEMGCAHPMGPLKLADLIGLDTVASVADSMYAEYKEPLYAAPRCSSGWWTRAARPQDGLGLLPVRLTSRLRARRSRRRARNGDISLLSSSPRLPPPWPQVISSPTGSAGSVEDMPQIGMRVGEVTAPVIDQSEVAPGHATHTVLTDLHDVRAGKSGQERRVGGTDDLAAVLHQLLDMTEQFQARGERQRGLRLVHHVQPRLEELSPERGEEALAVADGMRCEPLPVQSIQRGLGTQEEPLTG